MNAPLDSFETALLTRLRQHVDEQPVMRRRFSRARLLLGAAATTAAAAAMLVVVPGHGATAAYSVQEGNSGTITVEVRRLEDAKALEVELAKYGVTADITYLSEGQQCAPERYTPADRDDRETFVMAVSGQAVPPSSSEPSHEGITDMGGFAGWTDVDVTTGPVQPCRVVDGTLG